MGKPVSLADLPPRYTREGDTFHDRPEVQDMRAGFQTCPDCKHTFADTRPRCPACGTTPRLKPVKFRNQARFTDAPDRCALCRRKGKLVPCVVCDRRVHDTCADMHTRIVHRDPS